MIEQRARTETRRPARKLRKLGITLIVVLCAVAIWKTVYPTYSYRYRLFVELEIDGVAKSGSSVIEVSWIGQPALLPEVGSFILMFAAKAYSLILDREEQSFLHSTQLSLSPHVRLGIAARTMNSPSFLALAVEGS